MRHDVHCTSYGLSKTNPPSQRLSKTTSWPLLPLLVVQVPLPPL